MEAAEGGGAAQPDGVVAVVAQRAEQRDFGRVSSEGRQRLDEHVLEE
jgi:hypothetical protein